MKLLFSLLVIALLSVQFVCSEENSEEEDESTIKLNDKSKVKGWKFHHAKGEGTAGYVYYGIRYATAERFKPAALNDDFSYLKTKSHPKHGYVCPQQTMNMPGFPARNLSLNDDCLYLDIYAPSKKSDAKSLPVMVWIHGGGYQFGDKDIYNSTELAAAINAIVVTINYRVGALGFLSTEDGASKGNFGIGDAKIAIEWVKKYIAKFGGDPERVSIFGESAGGGIVSALFLDEKIRGSLQAGIAMSGSIVSPWSLAQNPKQLALVLANGAGCPNDTSELMVECLRKLPVDQLLQIEQRLPQLPLMSFRFLPSVDGEHIKDLPARVIANGIKTPGKEATFITGYLKEDFSLILTLINPQFFNASFVFDYAAFKESIGKHLVSITRCPHPNLQLVDDILAYYNVSETDTRAVLSRKFYWFGTDAFFGQPAIRESFLHSNRSSVTKTANQLFLISYDPGYNGLGAFHGMDLVHLFRGPFLGFMRNHTLDEEVTKSLRNMVHQVAYTGRIDGPDFGSEGLYVELGQSKKFENGTGNFSRAVEFWDKISSSPCAKSES